MCWPGCASVPSTTTWYSVTASASMRGEWSRPQPRGDPVEVAEELAVAPRQLRHGRAQPARQRPVAHPDDLVQEAMKEHRVARLVDLLGREEVLLLLERRGVDVRRQVVGDRVLAVEEQRVQPQRRGALLRRELVLPVLAVDGEVDLGRGPVATLPAGVEIGVVDLFGRGWDRHGHPARDASAAALRAGR